MVTKYLVINTGLTKEVSKVVGMFSTAQSAEAYKDKYDKGLLNDFMVIATLQLDDNGKFVSEGFDDAGDNTDVMESLIRKYVEAEMDTTPLEELFADLPGSQAGANVVVKNPQDLGEKNPFKDDPNGIKDEMKELK